MELNLNKGMSLDLTKQGAKKFSIGIRWDPNTTGVEADVDVSAFCLTNVDGLLKILDVKDVVFFNNLATPCTAVYSSGDNRDGAGAGDDETIYVDTTKINPNYNRINLYANIFSPLGLSFSTVKNAKATVYDENGKVLAVFNLTEDFQTENAILICTLRKDSGGNWSFVAEGEGYQMSDLNSLLQHLAAGIRA